MSLLMSVKSLGLERKDFEVLYHLWANETDYKEGSQLQDANLTRLFS